MLALVTGAAGFIGSNLTDRLLRDGWRVRAVDSFTPYYDRAHKEANIADALGCGAELHEVDLRTADLQGLLDGVDVVFHQAAQPGVRLSWSDEFAEYDSANVLATQRLLEAARHSRPERFVYASSSSVYGNAAAYPCVESQLPVPESPYGVTKLAAEHLCGLYARNWGIPTISLRYFTVYGPRQRPDMAIHRLIEAALQSESFPLYGDGEQIRDFTFVDDVVAANVAAATAEGVPPGTFVNISGGSSTTMNELVSLVADVAGHPIQVDERPAQPGDVRRTGGRNDEATSLFGWRPCVELVDGVRAQVDWHLDRLGS